MWFLISKSFRVRCAQVLGDGGDAVALLDGKTSDWQIRTVKADESDVGAVQGRNKWQVLARWCGCKHLLGQHRAYRVRNRIVHVQQVELVKLGDFGHPRGQRQIVRRIFKQWIAGDLDLVVVNIGFGSSQSNRL